LALLSKITGRVVEANELTSLDELASMREALQRLRALPVATVEIPFSDRRSERFKSFLQRLSVANPSPVYVWPPWQSGCGALLVSSLGAINFDFDFSINPEGLLAFSTKDHADRLLLDFSSTCSGEQYMKVETRGEHWASAAY
jgi:hypothetical protein